MKNVRDSLARVRNKVTDKSPKPAATHYEDENQCGFPADYFTIVFSKRNFLDVINPPSLILDAIREVLQNASHECKLLLQTDSSTGVRFKFSNEPFGNDSNHLKSCYQLFTNLTETLLNCGCEVISNGHLFEDTDRSVWIIKYDRRNSSLNTSTISIVGMEDLNKLVLYKAPNEVLINLKEYICGIWTAGIHKVLTEKDFHIVELGGQPWDSYKTDSEVTPLIIEFLITRMGNAGYSLLFSTHLRGSTDAMFFIETPSCRVHDLCLMSLSQQNQMRLYHIPADILQKIKRIVKEIWTKGVSEKVDPSLNMLNLVLVGSSWWREDWDKTTAANARKLIFEILNLFQSSKWNLLSSITIYRSQFDKTLFIFQLDDTEDTEEEVNVDPCYSAFNTFGFAPFGRDQIHIHCSSVSIRETILAIINNYCRGSSQTHFEKSLDLVEVNLDGRPWSWCTDHETNHCEGLRLVCWLCFSLRNENYTLTTAADISSSRKFSPFMWIFTKQIQ